MKVSIYIDDEKVNQTLDTEEELKKLNSLPVTGIMVRNGEIYVSFGNGITYVMPMSTEMADRWDHSGTKELRL